MDRDILPLLVAVIGPTATGKTDLGVILAKTRRGSVISADSRQVYSGMNIGTAKPQEVWTSIPHAPAQPDDIEGVKHYLFNIREPSQQLTLAEWQFFALKAVDRIVAEGRTPLLVGGTMLYADSIIYNYSLPEVPPDLAWRQEAEQRTATELYMELLELDPSAKGLVDPQNKRRIIRALEIVQKTGKPLGKQKKRNEPQYQVEMVGVFPGWDALKERITKRCQEWVEDGLLEETAALIERYGENLPLLETMNYRQAKQVLRGRMTKDEAAQEMVRVNMRYARRQMTWWRQRSEIQWFESGAEAMQKVGF